MKGATIAMAHLMKLTRGASGGLTRHFERFINDKGEYLKFGNQEIDTQKTSLNYNLADNKNQLEFIKTRLSEVRCLNRKDVNIMASWIITLPETITSQDDQELFFKEAYKFLEEKYGKENVISSFVHLDETTPHMHYAFMPIVFDLKKQIYKVSAKECITKNHLKSFHPELEKHMKEVFGRDIGILNEKTKEGNKSIDELKKGTAAKELNLLKDNIKDKEGLLDTLQNDLNALRNDLKVFDIAKDDIDEINEIIASRGLIRKEKVTLSEKDFEKLKEVAKIATFDTQRIIQPFRELLEKAIRENEGMKKEIDGLNKKLNKKESMADKINFAKKQAPIENLKMELEKKNKKIKELEKLIIDLGHGEKISVKTKSQHKSFER